MRMIATLCGVLLLLALPACDEDTAPGGADGTADTGVDAAADARGDVSSLPACDPAVSRPRTPAVCVGDGEELPDRYAPEGVTRTFRGEVVAVHDGLPDETTPGIPCFFGGLRVGHANDIAGYDRGWVELRDAEDAGRTWYVGWQLPADVGFALAAGDALSVDAHATERPFGPDSDRVTLRTADGALLAWLGHAAEAAELATPPEVTIRRGDATCHESTQCGAWNEYAQVVSSGDGAAVTIRHGRDAVVGPYRVHHLGEAEQTTTAGCPDWFVARSGALVTPAAPQ